MVVVVLEPGQSLCLGSQVRITLLAIKRRRVVKLGFEAAPSIPILRKETVDRRAAPA